MKRLHFCCAVLLTLSATLLTTAAMADVFNMTGEAYSLQFVPVGNAGNAADSTGYGAVDHAFAIGEFEVTAAQYVEFLNAVATTADPYGLWNYNMQGAIWKPGIGRGGTAGDYEYTVASNNANLPVGNISWGDAARFCNWLANGQPTGEQGLDTTEDGSYYLNGATTDAELLTIARKPGARYFIPTEDEWYKAAYHCNDGVTDGYWDYPTASDTAPSRDWTEPDPGNTANYHDGTVGGFCIVGARENSASAYGTFDQGGSLWEWNEAVIGAKRGLRGGSFGDTVDRLSAAYRYQREPSREYDKWSCNIGFRVATIPEPSGLLLLLSGGAAALLVWRRRAV